MTPAPNRNTRAGQVYNDLRNIARAHRRDPAEYFTLYALEGFLVRLVASKVSNDFVLKGGVLMAAFATRRPTRDIDLAATSARLATVGRFGRRKARAEHQEATDQTQTRRAQLRETWGEPPRTSEALPEWAQRQAQRRAEHHPRVHDADRAVEAAQAERENQQRRAAERARQFGDPFEHDPHRGDPWCEGPGRAL